MEGGREGGRENDMERERRPAGERYSLLLLSGQRSQSDLSEAQPRWGPRLPQVGQSQPTREVGASVAYPG